jgi:hypothetical protein
MPECNRARAENNYIYLVWSVTFMEFPLLLSVITFVIVAAAVVLQIVSLAQIAALKKKIAGLAEVRSVPAHVPHERQERKGGEFRRPEKRNFPEPRARQERAPAEPEIAVPAADPVEKSLRDINMKLKHAERDQETARKRIQDPLSRGDQHRGEGGRGDRNDRDRDGQRTGRRDNWQDRSRSGGAQSGSEAETADLPREPITGVIPPREIVAPSQETAAPQADIVADYTAEENLQHGRKIIVRRRMLREDAPQSGEGVEKQPEAGNAPQVSEPVAPEAGSPAEGGSESEIHFGRKRH